MPAVSITSRTMRHYEEVGLLSPVRCGQTRIYGRRDRARLKLALLGKRLGFSLAEIKALLDLYDPADGGRAQRRAALAKCREQVGLLEQQIREKSESIDELRQICEAIERENSLEDTGH